MASWTYIDGTWHEGNPPILGPMHLATWLGALVFDGARAFDGTAPDLDLHSERTVRSAEALGMKAIVPAEEIIQLSWDGIKKFPKGAELYIRPMFYAEGGWIYPDPETTRFCLSVYDAPLPPATGFSAGMVPFRRPAPDQAPTDAKAGCLYPNAGRALKWANQHGFDNGVVTDPIGNVAEFCTANLFMVRDGVVITPAPNGTFLNGITRQRVMDLLRRDGMAVEERAFQPVELETADEIFSTGNHGKVMPVNRFGERNLQPGPVFNRARSLYWDFAHSS